MFTVVIAPTNKCNLNCKYCFNEHNNSEDLLDMSMFEYLTDIVFRENTYVNFVWRGGEPLMVGKHFYKKVLAIQRQYSLRYGVKYSNSIQSNGTLLNKEWIRFLKKNNIALGISFDGLTNDIYRSDGSKIIEIFNLCLKMNYKVGCLVVVNNENINLVSQYNYIKKYVSSIKFNPCFTANNSNYSISPVEYAKNMIDLYKLWMLDKDNIQVYPLVNYTADILGVYNKRDCINGMCLGNFLDVNAKGIIRTCSHSSSKDYVIGNIYEYSSLTEIFNSDSFNQIVRKMIRKNETCKKNCVFFGFCRGGCCVSRMENSSFYCEYLKHLYPEIQKIISKVIHDKNILYSYNQCFKNVLWDSLSIHPELIIDM